MKLKSNTFLFAFLSIFFAQISFGQNEDNNKLNNLHETKKVEKIQENNILISYENHDFFGKNLEGKAEFYKIKQALSDEIIEKKPTTFKQSISIGGKPIFLTLEKVDFLQNNFFVELSSGEKIYQNLNDQVFYRGKVDGDNHSLVTLSIFKNELHYLIALEEGNYEIHPHSRDIYAGYFSKDNIDNIAFHEPEIDVELRENTKLNSGARYGSCIDIYVEVDHKAYMDLGSNTTLVTNWVNTIFNNVISVYAIHDVQLNVQSIFIWNTSDPYVSLTNLTAINTAFANRIQNTYSGRIAHLLSTRPLGGGISNGIGGICNQWPNYPGPQCLSGQLSTSNASFPNYSFNTYLVAHEMGHVLGLQHTHACVWNNTYTQIDDCGNVYANNNNQTPEGLPCFDDQNPILPVGGGTIMSQCNLINGTGINLGTGFGTIAGALLYNNYLNANCNTGVACGSLRPTNDNCEDAIQLTVNNSCNSTTFNNIRAKESGAPAFTCGSPSAPLNDVWFTVTVPTSGNLTIETSQFSGGLTDVVLQAYSGNCTSLTSIGCNDNDGTGDHALLVLTGQTVGATIYVRIVAKSGANEGYFNICAYDASIPCHPDYSALVAFYNSTGGANWTNKTGWQTGAAGTNCSVCTWYGVTCNAQGRVTDLRLQNNNLTSSSISNQLLNVTYLNYLVLYNNNLSGPIPTFLSDFDYLLTLDLGNNDFNGSIPTQLSNLTSLNSLYLDYNLLTGSLPASLANIDLDIFYVNNNNLSGCFPTGYMSFCDKATNFANNPLLANGISFATYCLNGNGGDEDNDGFCLGLGDCNDNDNTIFPNNTEVCDGKDNNCNGFVDDIANPLTNTWLGGSGTWNTPSSWSLGIVPQRCHNVVIGGNSNAIVTISTGINAVARSITIQSGRSLNIMANGTATIDYGLNLVNNGTITNNGTIRVMNILDNSLYGISNMGTLTNNLNSLIQITNSGIRSLSNNVSSVVNNLGNISIDGSLASPPNVGIYNMGSFTNSGTITVKNITGSEVTIRPNSLFQNQNNSILLIED